MDPKQFSIIDNYTNNDKIINSLHLRFYLLYNEIHLPKQLLGFICAGKSQLDYS